MITIFKNKMDMDSSTELVEFNDLFFNTVTSLKLEPELAKKIIQEIDDSELVSKFQIKSKFNGELLNIDKLSTWV